MFSADMLVAGIASVMLLVGAVGLIVVVGGVVAMAAASFFGLTGSLLLGLVLLTVLSGGRDWVLTAEGASAVVGVAGDTVDFAYGWREERAPAPTFAPLLGCSSRALQSAVEDYFGPETSMDEGGAMALVALLHGLALVDSREVRVVRRHPWSTLDSMSDEVQLVDLLIGDGSFADWTPPELDGTDDGGEALAWLKENPDWVWLIGPIVTE